MAVFEYKGHQFEADENMSESDWAQTTAYLDTLPAKEGAPTESKPKLARDISLEEDLANYSDMPFWKRAVTAPVDIAGGLLETTTTAIPMLATGMEHGVRQLYGKAVKGLSGDDLTQYAKDSYIQKNIAPELAPETMTGKAIGKLFEKGVVELPANIYAGIKAAAKGTGQSGAKDILSNEEKSVREWTDPLLEIGMGITGGRHTYKSIKGNKLESQPETTVTPSDPQIAKLIVPHLEDKITKLEDYVTDLVEQGRLKDDPSFNDHIAALQEQYRKLQKQRQELNNIIEGKTNDVEMGQAIKHAELMDTIKERIKAQKEALDPEEVAKKAEENRVLQEEQIAKQQESGPTIPDYITEPEKFVQAIEEQGKPKTTPTEVALTKIGEAKNMTDAELADHILNTEDKLSLIEDKPENSSLRENIKAELRAYEDIQAGREPDLSWFTNEEKPTIESITVKKPSIFKSEREALESSYIDGLVKTIEEFKPYKQEMDYLKDTRNPTIEQSLRLQELEDIYNKLLIKNDPINEYHGVRNTYVEELQLLKDLEKSDPDYVNQRRPLVEDMLTKLDEYRNKAEGNVSTEKPVVEDIIQIEAPKPNFTSIDDIFAHQGDTLTHLVDHSTEFFNRMSDRQYFIDRRIGELPKGDMITKMIGNMLDKVGLNKDRIFVTLEDRLNSGGKLNHFDDTSVIRLNREQLAKYAKTAIDNPSLFEGIRSSNLEGAKLAYAIVRVVSHEIGHIFTNKYLRSFGTMDNIHETIGKFKEYLKDNRIENISYQDWYDGGVSAQKLRDVQQYFHEFVAERVANHLLGDKDLMKGFRSDKTKSFRAVLEAGYKILKDYGLKIKDKTAYFDDVIKDILDTNKELVAKTGDTVWENADIANTDGYIFRGKTLQEVLNSDIVQAMLPEKKANEIFMGYDTIDHPSLSERAGRALGKGALKVAEVFWNRNNIVDIQFNDKPLTYFHKLARSLDFQIESVVNKLLYGDVPPKDVGFFGVFSKIKAGDSPYMTLKNSTRYDKYILHELFKKGFDEELDYQENLTKNGQHLTDKQKGYYNSLAKLFTQMYKESVKAQQVLKKKYSLPKRDGWYPSARSGRFSVTVNYGDLVAHAQHFSTRLQAEKFREKLQKSNIKQFNISDVIDLKDEQKTFNNQEVVENIVEYFTKLVPNQTNFFERKGAQLIESMLTRGGKLGQHHEFRHNVSGYMGSEFFKTPTELGESFGLAIEKAISEKGMQLKEMHYKTKLKPLIEQLTLANTHPNTVSLMQTMYDSALGKHVDKLNDFQEGYQYLGDKFVDEFLKVFNSEKTGDTAGTAATYDSMRSGFYLMYMMPKASFSTLGQLLSVPPMAIAKMSYERPLGAYKDFSMGTMKMLTANKDLWGALKEVSQKYNVFEPQYVESLTLHKSSHAIVEFIKDWALLRAPGKGFESGSRVWAFSVFYEHAKQIGMGRQEAIEFAMRKTGDSLNLYDKANTPPIFDKLGFVGDLVKPLASFGQNQLGNTIAMAKYGLSINPKKWMPLVSYSVLTAALVGGLGIQGVQEYEEFRKWLDRNDYAHLPSILDILATKRDGLDDVISPETRTLGVLSKTGYDIASSARANKTLPTMLAQEITAGMHLDKNGDKATPYDVMPLVSSALKVPAAVTTILSAITGRETTGSVKKAMDVLAPAGHVGYGTKEVMGLNETTIGGKNTGMKMVGNEGQAGFKRTPEDIKAGIMGMKTTEDKMTQLRDYEVQEEEKIRVEKLNKYGIMAVESGDPKWIKKMVDLGETTKNINNKLELEYSKRLIPLELRLMINTKGKIIKGRGERQAIGLSQFKK